MYEGACDPVNWSVKGEKVNDLCALCHWKQFWNVWVQMVKARVSLETKASKSQKEYLVGFWFEEVVSQKNIRWKKVDATREARKSEGKKNNQLYRRHIWSTRFTDLLCHLPLRINEHRNGRHQLFRGSPNANHFHRNIWRFPCLQLIFP